MSRFHVYQGRQGDGLFLDVQSDYLESYSTRMVVPLVSEHEFPRPASQLNPVIELRGQRYVALTHFMAAVPLASLGAAVGDLSNQSDEFTRALDLLFQGY
ncbi:CcdB family protein [Sulfitobacter mediterraneus]|jgi:toxin CcdB|uniref:CcdB family protein n=1 Tax=Sulfitobacter mediterraneus TaxID=83219 RepID=UPI000EA2ADCB|nr:CcdB family protein [Sulfitobacter mediterraneus]